MKTTIIALAFAASLIALPATAQQAGMGHGAHHAPAAGEGGMSMPGMGMGMMQDMPIMMQDMPMMRGMMQNMPMMQGMGHGMMMGGMGGMSGMGGGPTGDQSVSSLALDAVNQKMHREMAITYTGNVDVDFVRGMIAHHQGAIDMAKVVKAFGSDAQIRELAEAIIEAQEAEIAMMNVWLAENASQ